MTALSTAQASDAADPPEHAPRGPGRPSSSFPVVRRRPLWTDWPAPDRDAWQAALAPAGPLEPAKYATTWSSATRFNRCKAWGQYLSFLETQGWLVQSQPPGDRLTLERVTAFIRCLKTHLNANSVHQTVVNVFYAIRAMVPERDWRWVRRHPERPRPAEVNASRKPVVPFDPVELVRRALDACDGADGEPASQAASVRFRDGVLILVAVTTALRRRNLAQLRIATEVQVTASHIRIYIPPEETKTHQAIDLLVTRFVEPYLRRYIAVHRPLLLGDEALPHLWIADRGAPLTMDALHRKFGEAGQRLLGRKINPHLCRHSLATSILMSDPRAVRTASAALGHRGTRVLQECYDRSGTRAAQDEWVKLLKTLRRRRSADPIDD